MFIFILFFLILENHSLSKTKKKTCKWNNNSNACLEISKNLYNISKFTNSAIRRNIITREDIENSGSIDLVDVLKNIPNINITQSGSKGQTASIFMRGTGSNHTLVLINGVSITDQSQTQGLFDFGLDFIQTIQQIEVYQGPSVTNFGAKCNWWCN